MVRRKGLFVDIPDNVEGEVSEPQVNPWDEHESVANELQCKRSNVNGQLEDTHAKVSNVMEKDDCSTWGHLIQIVREHQQTQSHEMVEEVFGKVDSLSLEEHCVD